MRRARTDEAAAGLAHVLGCVAGLSRAPRILGVFAHPDDEVFCVGGTMARCADAGAVTGIVSLTQGEAGQIRDATAATRRTLGGVRHKELEASAVALGVDQVTCLDLGDGRLAALPLDQLAATVRTSIDEFMPDVVVTFGPDGGFGHPDHVTSCRAAIEAIRTMVAPPRVLHAAFPVRKNLMVDMIVEWLVSQPTRFRGSAQFCRALKLFADGTSTLGVTADHVRVEWFPPGSYIIEQDEPATELFCIMSGTADVVVEFDNGRTRRLHTTQIGDFVGEEGLATGRPRNAHVIARDAVTCLVLAAEEPSHSAGRGERATTLPGHSGSATRRAGGNGANGCFAVDVRSALPKKVAALAAHRSQYALEVDLLPQSMLECLLGTEYFVVADG